MFLNRRVEPKNMTCILKKQKLKIKITTKIVNVCRNIFLVYGKETWTIAKKSMSLRHMEGIIVDIALNDEKLNERD